MSFHFRSFRLWLDLLHLVFHHLCLVSSHLYRLFFLDNTVLSEIMWLLLLSLVLLHNITYFPTTKWQNGQNHVSSQANVKITQKSWTYVSWIEERTLSLTSSISFVYQDILLRIVVYPCGSQSCSSSSTAQHIFHLSLLYTHTYTHTWWAKSGMLSWSRGAAFLILIG